MSKHTITLELDTAGALKLLAGLALDGHGQLVASVAEQLLFGHGELQASEPAVLLAPPVPPLSYSPPGGLVSSCPSCSSTPGERAVPQTVRALDYAAGGRGKRNRWRPLYWMFDKLDPGQSVQVLCAAEDRAMSIRQSARRWLGDHRKGEFTLGREKDVLVVTRLKSRKD